MSDSICTEFLNDHELDFSHKFPIPADKIKLLSHYRARISLFEREREEWLEKLEGIRHNQEAFVQALKKVKADNDQIYRLQTQLSEIQNTIFNERQQVMKLSQENDMLTLQEHQDLRKINEYMTLNKTQPRDTTFFQDKRPGSTKKNNNDCNWCQICKAYNGAGHNHKVGKATSTPKHMLRTVYLPNEEMNSLAIEVDILKKQLNQEKDMYESELDALADEDRVREQEMAMRKEVDEDKIRELRIMVEKEEEAKVLATKEYLKLRHEKQTREKQLRERQRDLEDKLGVTKEEFKDFHNDAKQEIKEIDRQAQKKTKEFSHKFRTQAMEGEESLNIIKEQYATLQGVYAEKISDLENRLSNLVQNHRDLEEKRRISSNKYSSEIDSLRDQLSQIEKEKENENQPNDEIQRPKKKPVKTCQRCKKKYEDKKLDWNN